MNNGLGFQIEFNAKYTFRDCGGVNSNISGIFTSPSHPHAYPPMADCTYLITQPNGSFVNLTIIAIDIDCQSYRVTSDFIDVEIGRSHGGGTAFSIASQKAHFDVMRRLIVHGKLEENKGWWSDNWSSQTVPRNNMDSLPGSTSLAPKTNGSGLLKIKRLNNSVSCLALL